MQNYTYLRYTGTRVGSQPYPAPGYPKIAFGQNPTHFQQLVTVETAAYLRRMYSRELLEIPLYMGDAQMALDAEVGTLDQLRTETKGKLRGYRTLGEVIADEDAIYAMFDKYDATEILNAIRDHFGLPLLHQQMKEEVLPVVAEYVAEYIPDAVTDEPKKARKKTN